MCIWCVHVGTHAYKCRCPGRTWDPLELELQVLCKLTNTGAGNQTPVFGKTNKCSQLRSPLSSPLYLHFN